MSNRLARFLLIFTACVLPLQTQAAVSMQLPMLDAARQQSLVGIEETHCPYHDAAATVDQGQSRDDRACNDCGLCHLAATGFIPSAEIKTGVAPQQSVFQARSAASLHSHIPEPPQYPPKRSA